MSGCGKSMQSGRTRYDHFREGVKNNLIIEITISSGLKTFYYWKGPHPAGKTFLGRTLRLCGHVKPTRVVATCSFPAVVELQPPAFPDKCHRLQTTVQTIRVSTIYHKPTCQL